MRAVVVAPKDKSVKLAEWPAPSITGGTDAIVSETVRDPVGPEFMAPAERRPN